MSLLEGIEAQVERFVLGHPQFQQACGEAFKQVEDWKSHTVPAGRVHDVVPLIFEQLAAQLAAVDLAVEAPGREEVERFLQQSDTNRDGQLNQAEFEAFMLRLLKYAAAKCAGSFAQRYGLGIALGVLATTAATRTVKRLPLVGWLVGTTLGPIVSGPVSVLVGAALGIAGTWGYNRGDLLAVKKRLFPPKPPAAAPE